jgi:hypothetical protein
MRECALRGCEREVPRRGARYCSPAHKQRAYEIRKQDVALLDATATYIRHAERGIRMLRNRLVDPSGVSDRTGPTS